MTQYFFHMATRDKKLLDSVGKHLSSLNAAHEHALHLINRTMKYVETPCNERWMIEVCSGAGSIALVVLFPVLDHWAGGWTSSCNRQDVFSVDILDAP